MVLHINNPNGGLLIASLWIVVILGPRKPLVVLDKSSIEAESGVVVNFHFPAKSLFRC